MLCKYWTKHLWILYLTSDVYHSWEVSWQKKLRWHGCFPAGFRGGLATCRLHLHLCTSGYDLGKLEIKCEQKLQAWRKDSLENESKCVSSLICQVKRVCVVGICKSDHSPVLKPLVSKSLRVSFFNGIFNLAIKSWGLCSVAAQRGKGMFSDAWISIRRRKIFISWETASWSRLQGSLLSSDLKDSVPVFGLLGNQSGWVQQKAAETWGAVKYS